MEINLSGNPTLYEMKSVSVQAETLTAKLCKAPKSSVQAGSGLSPLAAFSKSYGLSEISLQGNQTSLGYRSDGSLAVKVQSSLDYSLRYQQTTIDMTVSADDLGDEVASKLDFSNGPLQLNIENWTGSVSVKWTRSTTVQDTLRKPEEILRDIVSAMRDALDTRDGKSGLITLDSDALKALMSDEKFAKAVDDITALVLMVNMLALQSDAESKETIQISGKGQDYLDIRENTSVSLESNQVNINLTILPPESQEAASEESGVELITTNEGKEAV